MPSLKDTAVSGAAAVVAALTVFGVMYLLGAFYAASFNIAEWGEGTRLLVTIFGGGLGFVVAVFVSFEKLEKYT